MTDPLLAQWRRDLRWAITSPCPLSPLTEAMPDAAWFDRFAAGIPIDHWVPAAPPAIGHKVGFYFEWLWQQALEAHPDYQLLAANLAIVEHKRTLGALDLLVYDRRLERHEHWELAIKFYLGIGNQPAFDHWVGPGLRDRFDRKWRRLCHHQLPLSRCPAATALLSAQGVTTPVQRLILKGVFFRDARIPTTPTWLNPAGPAAHWLTLSDFHLRTRPETTPRYSRLCKPHWLAPPCGSPASLQPAALTLPHGPIQLLAQGAACHDGRLFVVPDSWPDKAQALPDTGH